MFTHFLAFIYWEIIWVQWKNPESTSTKKSAFFVAFVVSFLNLLFLCKSFLKEATIDFGRAWNSLSPCILVTFLAFMCWKIIRALHRHASWQALKTSSCLLLSLSFSVSKVHDDREFQALSEYIITCSKSYPYINNKIEITREVLLKKFSFFKFLDHVSDVTLQLFFSRFST